MTEEYCADYIENVLRPALGYPLPRDTHPGEQGVIVCYGVGSHLCFVVVEKAIELGLEILLRVPNLSYGLQGEDTVNFKVSTTLLCYYVDVVVAAATVVVALAAIVVDATDAFADADVASAFAAAASAFAAAAAIVVDVVVVADVVAAAAIVVADVVVAVDVLVVAAATNAAANACDACDA